MGHVFAGRVTVSKITVPSVFPCSQPRGVHALPSQTKVTTAGPSVFVVHSSVTTPLKPPNHRFSFVVVSIAQATASRIHPRRPKSESELIPPWCEKVKCGLVYCCLVVFALRCVFTDFIPDNLSALWSFVQDPFGTDVVSDAVAGAAEL